MLFTNLPKLKIGALEAKLPIVQGGMGLGISLAGLASAVANEGGIGVISATGIGEMYRQPGTNLSDSYITAIREEVKKARKMTKGILGINILMALTDFAHLAQIAHEEGIDLIFLGAGLPIHKPETLSPEVWQEILKKTVPIVSSGRAARIICKHWDRHFKLVPDAFVIEGPLAGGHLGFHLDALDAPENQLEHLLADVSSVIRPFEEKWKKPISLVAAGGVYDGTDMFRFLQLGAQGIQMGTRFVATNECDATDAFKQLYINCKKEDLTIIKSPVGLPGRAINNNFLQRVAEGTNASFKCPWKCLVTCDFKKAPYCIGQALLNAWKGQFEEGFAFAGANAYRVKNLVSVKELMDSLVEEFNKEVDYFKTKLQLLNPTLDFSSLAFA